MNFLATAWRLARRDLRGGIGAFRLFLACLAVGVATIAGVASLRAALMTGLGDNARAMLGGEAEIRNVGRDFDDEAMTWLAARATRLSRVIEMRAMAQRDGQRSLVELKAVDGLYPLHGAIRLEPAIFLAEALRNGGAIAEPTLFARLGLGVGDRVRLGDREVVLRAI
ncbi:MAG: hypothetical protein FJX47_14525, partial [Alphaproteobacteria bacterium]|nr:hypothetical protein [Alphaproteobacteria bacterium]